MNIHQYLLVFLVGVVLSGCVSIPSSQPVRKPVTDTTFGRYQENLEADLILITMTPEYQALYTEMKLVPMSGELPPRYDAFLGRLKADFGLTRVANWPLPAIDVFCVIFQLDNPERRELVVAALEQEPDIETAQLVQTFDAQQDSYNDPYLSLQHGFHSIQAIQSHQWARGKGVRIALIDTGMDDTHADLSSSSELTRNFVDSDEVAFRADTHGTAVGGVIAAEADNNTGMVGVAPEASLLALKACWHVHQGQSEARCNTLTLAKALSYSIEQQVDIINLSLTGPPDPVLGRLVKKAISKDIVVVGAKPNHNENAFPVSVEGTIAVAMPGSHASLISAPGRQVLSTHPNDEYEFYDGSSFSTAHIAGLAALIRSVSPDLSPGDMLSLLERTANSNTGGVNACKALEMAAVNTDIIVGVSGCY